MKKFILTIAISWISVVAIAQRHYHSPNIDKFAGTWLYHEDGKEVEITLRVAATNVVATNDVIDELEGFEVYKLNGRTIHNSKKDNKISLNTGLVQDRIDANLVKILYFDELKQKTGEATIHFIAGEPDKIKWSLVNTEGIRVRLKGQPEFDRSFTIPQVMVLERKN